jgi:hypothetical protein
MPNRLIGLANHSFAGAVALFVAGLFPVSGNAETAADSFAIMVLDAQYSTDLTIKDGHLATIDTQTMSGNAPIGNELLGPLPGHHAKAEADTFSVFTDAAGNGGYAYAAASTALTFTSLVTQQGSAGISFGGDHQYFGNGLVSLYDVTANRSLFSYGWGGLGDITLPFPLTGFSVSKPLELFASHVYALNLYAYVNATNDPGGRASISVQGFRHIASPIPEPEAYAMTLVSFGVLWLMMRRRKGKMV